MPSKHVGFRLPVEAKTKLEAIAAAAGKSLTRYVISRLPRSIFRTAERKRRK